MYAALQMPYFVELRELFVVVFQNGIHNNKINLEKSEIFF